MFPADPAARGTSRSGGGPKYKTPKFVEGFSGLDSVLLTEDSILDACYAIWELIR
jgi:hypothetical protein